MTIKKLLYKTRENYVGAINTENEYYIVATIEGYLTLRNLKHMNLISTNTYNKYFNEFYYMAYNVWYIAIHNDNLYRKVNNCISNAFMTLKR